ncbi:MAG TPA: hypothetical protein VM619_02535 [Luteimonas sp.]|nr:hypothetical protein [Luteimonas sp.]
MSINETVLEMHFHHALMDLFRSTLGVGPTGKISFYKYSPQKECFVGFDQAWVMTDVPDETLFKDLKEAAQGASYNLKSRYVGYFLQYKVVKRMVRKPKKKPNPVASAPYGRVAISNQANINSGSSQHELLFNLCKNKGALTYYACPSIFDKAELYKAEADLGKLHLVDVTSCPSDFKDNQKHHIYFELPSMDPTWCSDPVPGVVISAEQMAKGLTERLRKSPREEADRLFNCLTQLRAIQRERENTDFDLGNNSDWGLQALTVIRVDSIADT